MKTYKTPVLVPATGKAEIREMPVPYHNLFENFIRDLHARPDSFKEIVDEYYIHFKGLRG